MNSKLKIGEREGSAVRSVVRKDRTKDDTIKVIGTMHRQKQEESQQSRTIQAEECSERSTLKRQRNECLKAANSRIIMWMEDTMEKLKQKNVRFVENLKKGYSYITKIKTERIMKLIIFRQSVISVMYIFICQIGQKNINKGVDRHGFY